MSDTERDVWPDEVLASIVGPVPVPAEGRKGVIGGYGEYELDVEQVLREKLPLFFDALEATPLSMINVSALPERSKGAYLLFKGRSPVPVYAGKTDTTHGFRDRLSRHAWTVQGRLNLDPLDMSYKAVRIMVFAALDAEAILIREMRARMPGSLAWNNSGFGSNDPGRNRDGQRPGQFDQDFPVNIDFAVPEFPCRRDLTVVAALELLKKQIPYLIRYADIPDYHPMPEIEAPATVRSVLTAAMASLPSGYQTTVLHGRIIIYRQVRDYDYMLEVIRS